MPLPRPYAFRGKTVLAEIVKLGLAPLYGALFGELQFKPRDSTLGVRRMRGGEGDFSDDYLVHLGPTWLYYHVSEEDHAVDLIELIHVL